MTWLKLERAAGVYFAVHLVLDGMKSNDLGCL